MASNVVVLAPNGRRQTIKVTPNTTILQILEEVCIKQDLIPEEYDIKHHRKILDTSSTIRFSGLPNNAQLELSKAVVARKEAEVILVIQLEDGNRLMGNFLPSNNLLEVLTKLCPAELSTERHTIIIYMRQEIFSNEAFEKTTLKSLGLMGGRAMLRLIHRSPEILRTQANVSAPLPIKPVEEKPYIRQLIKSQSPKEPLPSQDAIVPSSAYYPPTENKVLYEPPKKPSLQQKPIENVPIVNVIKQEKRKQTDGIRTKNHSEKAVSMKPPPEEFVFLGERNAMLFSLETSQKVRSDDLPDDFFELSITDIKKLFRDIKKQRMEVETGGPLLTAAMRQLEESKKQLRHLNQYKKAVIRVQFPTRVVLQGIFTPTETIQHVAIFVREYLADKSLDFYLFTTPPKKVLENEFRLIEVDCVPGALLHFGCDIKHDTYLRSDILDKMTDTSVASFAANKVRDENKRNVHRNTSIDFDETTDVNVGASTSSGVPVTVSYEDYEKKPTAAAPPEKVPKWFKPTK